MKPDESSRGSRFQSLDTIALNDDPIRPEWVLSGRPQARSGCHSTNTDGWAATYVWECSAGRFRWHYEWEETVLILDGEVRVTDAAGRTEVLRAGNVGYFPSGSWWIWEVPQRVRKLSFNRRTVVRPARALSRLLTALGSALRRRNDVATTGPYTASTPTADHRRSP